MNDIFFIFLFFYFFYFFWRVIALLSTDKKKGISLQYHFPLTKITLMCYLIHYRGDVVNKTRDWNGFPIKVLRPVGWPYIDWNANIMNYCLEQYYNPLGGQVGLRRQTVMSTLIWISGVRITPERIFYFFNFFYFAWTEHAKAQLIENLQPA